MTTRNKIIWNIAVLAVCILVFLLQYYYLFKYPNLPSDIYDHSIYPFKDGKFNIPFLHSWLINALSGFSSDFSKVVLVGYILSALGKYSLFPATNFLLSKVSKGTREPGIYVISTLLFFAAILEVPYLNGPTFAELIANANYYFHYYYVGSLPINNWHNTSSLLTFAPALLLSSYAIDFLNGGKLKSTQIITIIILLWLIKPSFLFIYSPAVIVTIFLTKGINNVKAVSFFLIGLFSLLLVAISFYLVFVENLESLNPKEKTGIAFAPFEILKIYRVNVLGTLFVSYLLPIVIFIFLNRNTKRNVDYKYAWVLSILGLLLGLFINETGERKYHGNFSWQIQYANYFLFLISLRSWYFSEAHKIIPSFRFTNWRQWTVTLLLVIHFFSGLIYVAKLLLMASRNNFYYFF